MNLGIPEANESGVAGTQLPSSGERPLIDSELVNSPVAGLTIAKAVQGLAASNPRCLGGEVGATMIAGSFADAQRQLVYEQRDHSQTRLKLEQTQFALTNEKVTTATLSERLRANGRTRHFSNVGIAIGCTIVGLGVQSLQSNQPQGGAIFLAVGLLLVLLCFFLPTPDSKP